MDSDKIRRQWSQRQQDHGNDPKSVLMKGVHSRFNQTIDLWHRHVIRRVFGKVDSGSKSYVLDIGCGYGRLANELEALGFLPIGLDFTPGFCKTFLQKFEYSVCADLSALPFSEGSIFHAYSVTSLMYVDSNKAKEALSQVDQSLVAGAIVLILEPSYEFNRFIRFFLPQKGLDNLAVPGFRREQFYGGLAPSNWVVVESGSNIATTVFLPLLLLFGRWRALYAFFSRLVLFLDRPSSRAGWLGARIAMYRWVAYRKMA